MPLLSWNLKAVAWLKVQLVTPLRPGATESHEFASPEVRENVGVKVAVEEALAVLAMLEVEEAIVVEDEDAIEDEAVAVENELEVEDEVAVVDVTAELVDTLPERVPEMTLLPELEGEPSEDLSQHVPEPMPFAPPT